jgi:hypothetical protein
MAQRKQVTWTELRVGLFVLVGLSVLAAGIFYVTGAGTIGPKYRLITYLPDVSGLVHGAPVRMEWKSETSNPLIWRLTHQARRGRKTGTLRSSCV